MATAGAGFGQGICARLGPSSTDAKRLRSSGQGEVASGWLIGANSSFVWERYGVFFGGYLLGLVCDDFGPAPPVANQAKHCPVTASRCQPSRQASF